MTLQQELADVIAVAHDSDRSIREVGRQAAAFVDQLQAAGPPQWEPAVLQELAAGLAIECPQRAGIIANICGIYVEGGADPRPAAEMIMPRLPALIAGAQTFLDACLNELEAMSPGEAARAGGPPEAEDDLDDEVDPFDAVAERMADVLPDAARAWQGLEFFHTPVVAVLSADKQFRRESRHLLPAIEPLVERHGGAQWLELMLSVLDDEPILVLEPEHQRGLLGTIGGIADNFQLNMLLMDALPQPSLLGILGKGRLPRDLADLAKGIGPQQLDKPVTGPWNLYAWRALGPGGTLPDPKDYATSDFWIWNEGKPADIPTFDGRRVIVLGPASYPRSWNACRQFDGMRAELIIERLLPPGEVDQWIGRLSSAR